VRRAPRVSLNKDLLKCLKTFLGREQILSFVHLLSGILCRVKTSGGKKRRDFGWRGRDEVERAVKRLWLGGKGQEEGDG
jgi:hypothetical protein